MDAVERPTLLHQFLSMSKYRCRGLLTQNMASGEVMECAKALVRPELDRQEKVALIQRAVEDEAYLDVGAPLPHPVPTANRMTRRRAQEWALWSPMVQAERRGAPNPSIPAVVLAARIVGMKKGRRKG